MGLTQLQMAEKLHVDPKVVESLEGERFDALGAPVFVRGHLKRYADFIGEKAAELVEIYVSASKAAAPDLTRLPKAAPETKPSKLAVPALLVLIAFVLLGVFWWIFQSVKSTSEIRPAPGAREVPVEPDLSPPLADAQTGAEVGAGVAGEAAGAATSGDAASTSASRAASGASPAAAGAAGAAGTGIPGAGGATNSRGGAVPSAAGNASTGSSANTGATTAGGASGTAGAATAGAGKPMQVTLKFTADSWVEIYDAKGEKLFYDIGSADSQRTITGTPPFRVTFGNAPGVTFDVNGKSTPVPTNAIKDDTAQFVINPSGRAVRARVQPQGPQASGSPQRAAAPPEGT